MHPRAWVILGHFCFPHNSGILVPTGSPLAGTQGLFTQTRWASVTLCRLGALMAGTRGTRKWAFQHFPAQA